MKYRLLPIFLLIGFCSFAAPQDSLRTEKIDGQLFVIHKVDPQETLFGLSRRYNVSVDEIKKFNPSIAAGLKIGDLLRIPLIEKATQGKGKKHVVSAGETLFSISKAYGVSIDELRSINALIDNNLSLGQDLIIPQDEQQVVVVKNKSISNDNDYLWHKVEPGETLYGLSLVYAADLDQLKSWNKLQDNTISIGDSLIVGEKNNKNNPTDEKKDEGIITTSINKDNSVTSSQNHSIEAKSVENDIANVEVTREVVKNAADFEEIVETGLAELIEGSGDSKKYLALHRTAKIGTIIRVHNEMNGQEVFVRVIGPLPDTGVNEKLLIKISKAAFDRLAAIDKKFRVRISYFPD